MTEKIIRFQHFREAYDELREDLDTAYTRFMESGRYVLGEEVESFESDYARFTNAAYCIGVGSGLEALHLTLKALKCGKGDEVIVPSNTYIATWLAVTHTGATAVPVEPLESNHTLNPSLAEEAITPSTKVILAVNLYGHPCDYGELLTVSRKHGIKLVIDNAQAHGAQYNGERVGGIADAECHSFYPSKNLGAYGEAGAVTTNNPKLAEEVQLLRNYGSRKRYENETLGFNARLDALQAAFLKIKLKHLDAWNARRSELASIYLNELSALDEKQHSLSGFHLLPKTDSWAKHVWHLFVIRHPRRDDLRTFLKNLGIETLCHYPTPPHLSQAYSNFSFPPLPIAEKLANQVLSLPLGPHFAPEEIALITRAINSFK